MAEERVVERQGAPGHPDGTVVPMTERTGEGDVYYTEPRYAPGRAVPVEPAVAPWFARDRIRWAVIFAGLVIAMTALIVLLMLGLAIGLSVFGPGSDAGTVGVATGIWTAVSAFLAFVIGGWVAGRTAGVENAGNALLNGFMVGALALIFLFLMAAAGIGNLFGIIGNAAGGIFHAAASNPGAFRGAFSDPTSFLNNANVSTAQAYDQARAGAWYIFASVVIGLFAATLGGWLGYLSRPARALAAHLSGGTGRRA